MALQAPTRFGGSFAPPITDDLLDQYRELAKGPEYAEAKSYMVSLINMFDKFLDEEDSKQPKEPHPSGMGHIQKLEDKTIKKLFDHVPWPKECDAYQEAFEEILPVAQDAENSRRIQEYKEEGGIGLPDDFKPTLRYAAFHLLWFAKELSEDRQPLTNDQLH